MLVQFVYLSLWALLVSSKSLKELKGTDSYSEELLLKRLPSEQILSQFRFVVGTDLPLSSDYATFPRIIGEVISKYDIHELHLSLTQGLWRTGEWGLAPQPSSPSGAQLYAWFGGEPSTVDDRWNHLVNSMNGIFCTSLLQMVPSLSVSPNLSFLPNGPIPFLNASMLRYGAMTGENVCTENLTPWRKLLPCKQTGLSMLLNPIKLYSGIYHSMSVHLTRKCKNEAEGCNPRARMEFNLNLVSDVNARHRTLDWSLHDLFGRKVDSQCEVADSSVVIFQRDRTSVIIDDVGQQRYEHDGRVFMVYDISTMPSNAFPFNLMARYKARLNLHSRPRSLFRLHSYLGGSDQQSGRVISVMQNRQSNDQRAVYTHVIPWFMRVYFHSIRFQCRSIHNKRGALQEGVVHRRHFVAAKDRLRPYLLEWDVTVPKESTCDFSFLFDKAFLQVNEFPPDANHGNYVPAASLTFDADAELWNKNRSAIGGSANTAMDELLGERTDRTVVMFGEALLVSLPVPDFSMPFNVICLVCTAMAMLFGPVHSLTTRSLIPLSEKDKDLAPKPPVWRLIDWIRNKVTIIVNRIRNRKKSKNITGIDEDVTQVLDNETEQERNVKEQKESENFESDKDDKRTAIKSSATSCVEEKGLRPRKGVHRARRVD